MRLANLTALGIFGLALVVALVLAFDALGLGRPETGDQVTVEGKVERDIGGLVLDTGGERLLLSGIEQAGVPVKPGDEVRVGGEFFEFSIHQMSSIQVERVERR